MESVTRCLEDTCANVIKAGTDHRVLQMSTSVWTSFHVQTMELVLTRMVDMSANVIWFYQTRQFNCLGPKFYLGKDCEIVGVCARSPCKNSAECIQKSVTEYRCVCPEGYTGRK